MRISLTDFVDFTLRSGPPKVTKVREIKNRDSYEPAVDFWKPLREGIADLHRAGGVTRAGLQAVIDEQVHGQKLKLYPPAVSGYLRFLGKKKVQWFEPPKASWAQGRLEVRVNPEIGLVINGRPTIVKLYFKAEELSRPRVQASIGVMEAALRGRVRREVQFGVLDVQKGKLHLADARWTAADTQILVKGEARSFVEIWDAV